MTIKVRGAKTHNLKSINVDIPRDKLTIITGLSGCGKSSLAFDTIYAEGQRRYVESLSAYARQFLSLMEKPDVDSIEGLSPAIAIQQKASSHNPRSTVGTVTEIYDYLRLLFARVGLPYCPTHQKALDAQTISQMVENILLLPENTKVMILAPVIKERKGEHLQLIESLQAKGYLRVRINKIIYAIDELPQLNAKQKHQIDVVVDRCKIKQEHAQRLSESLENAVSLSGGLVIVAAMENDFDELLFSANFACPHCSYSLNELSPRLFSFNSPIGACQKCDGLGVIEGFDEEKIIRDEDLSIAQGVVNISNIDFQSLAERLNFSLHTPYKDLPEHIKQVIMFGERPYCIGIIPELEKKYTSYYKYFWLQEFRSAKKCASCAGDRITLSARCVKINNSTLPELSNMTVAQLHHFFLNIKLSGAKKQIATKINEEIIARLGFLIDVGLDYLTISRTAETLSGGETQRIRLASQIGSGLVGVMYVLDEPSIGLHQRDNQRLLDTLFKLRDLGNSVIVVEHDEDTMRHADHIIDIGPGAGVHGGEVIFSGQPANITTCSKSLTGKYLSGELKIAVPKHRQPVTENKFIKLRGINCNNLLNLNVDIPLGLLVCVTGVSGSGKSSLINDTLYPIAAAVLNGSRLKNGINVSSYQGLEHCDKVIDIDQSPIGRTPRSNPATYTGLLSHIRDLFAKTPEARTRGYQPGRFSFNVKGGRCEACQGDGVTRVEMHFLPDIFVACDVCKGQRYNHETLTVNYKGKNIADILNMTVEDAAIFFASIPAISKKCATLEAVGLGYITLGQSAVTLSGGEAQRIKLSKELSKRSTGNTLYILDEPTTGLHFHDVAQLLNVIQRLKEQGNSIIIIEHNLDVIKTADWIIDMGPEGGNKGGLVIASGTPEDIVKQEISYTGRFLQSLLQ